MKILKINMGNITFNTFNIGDIVDVLPYDLVEEHHGISISAWNDFYKHNPHEIIGFSFRGSALLNFDNSWAWLASALELYYEKNMPDIMEMV